MDRAGTMGMIMAYSKLKIQKVLLKSERTRMSEDLPGPNSSIPGLFYSVFNESVVFIILRRFVANTAPKIDNATDR